MENFLSKLDMLTDRDRDKISKIIKTKHKSLKKHISGMGDTYLIQICSAKTSSGQPCRRRCVDMASNYCRCHVVNPDRYREIKPRNIVNSEYRWDNRHEWQANYIHCQYENIKGISYLVDDSQWIYDSKTLALVGRKVNHVMSSTITVPVSQVEWFGS